jgi:mRNA-degrading endonuclease RelE of RelBE toxin-antitoxin system
MSRQRFGPAEQVCLFPVLNCDYNYSRRRVGATWELRFGPHNHFRVFYEVSREEQAVCVLAIGVKERNNLFIGGEEFEL